MKIQNILLSLLVASFAFVPELVLAQGMMAGEASTMIESFADTLQIIIGVVATIALMWQFAEGFMGRKTWADVFVTSAWIMGAGAAIALAGWIFASGTNISF